MNAIDILYDAAVKAGNQGRAEYLVARAARLQRLTEWQRALAFPVLEVPFEEGPPTREKVAEVTSWLLENRALYQNKYALFYHGTSASLDIEKTGLLPTSARRRRSFQSQSGYVYLANTPERAKVFGDLGNQSHSAVYEVAVLIRKLSADTDQLRNQRVAHSIAIGNSVGESIVFGGGVRYRGKIEPYAVRRIEPEATIVRDPKGAVIPLSTRFPALADQPTFRADPEEYAYEQLRDLPRGKRGVSHEAGWGQAVYVFREDGGKAVGLLKCAGTEITDVAVAKKYRKRGIAGQLVDAAVLDGATSVRAPFTPASIALFEKKGFLSSPVLSGRSRDFKSISIGRQLDK